MKGSKKDGGKKKVCRTEDDVMYWLLLEIILAAALAAAICRIFRWNIPAVSCVMRHMTGLYCPGCGGTRALQYLLCGEIRKSLFYHPVVPYTAVVASAYLISQTLMRLTKGKVPGMKFKMAYCYIGVAILTGNFLWKNYYLIAKGILLIP